MRANTPMTGMDQASAGDDEEDEDVDSEVMTGLAQASAGRVIRGL